MKKHLTSLFIFFLSAVISPLFAKNTSVEGVWRTFDLSGTPRSIVRFSEHKGQVTGVIVKVLTSNGAPVCNACKGRWHNQPLVGLPIIWGLRQEGDKWVNGYVLNVDNGKIYRCTISLSQNNQIMHFKAYVGTPLFGKTINWARVN